MSEINKAPIVTTNKYGDTVETWTFGRDSKTLPILTEPDLRLRMKALPFFVPNIKEDPNGFLRNLFADMTETMRVSGGVGLAATQVDIPLRIIVLAFEPYCMINPVIVWESKDTITDYEGCLSCPGKRWGVRRPEAIDVSYYDRNGMAISKGFVWFPARVISHEIDHLNGKLIIDYMNEELARGE